MPLILVPPSNISIPEIKLEIKRECNKQKLIYILIERIISYMELMHGYESIKVICSIEKSSEREI